MTEKQIQARMSAGEVVFSDGTHVFFRVKDMGYRDHPWHYSDPLVVQFKGAGGDMVYLLQEFVETRWWTPEHERQMRGTLAGLGIELSPRAADYLKHSRRIRL
jgi:hypothetical protein